MGLGIFGGLITGLIVGWIPFFLPPPADKLFDDKQHWYECEIDHELLNKMFKAKTRLFEDENNTPDKNDMNQDTARVQPLPHEDPFFDTANVHDEKAKQ